ncbi:MAG TPA: protein-L-isoaspartate(D-aspartate) O-methyltransferase [Dehalococcoidia bacterium]|nr:protein-L-isoaspartate(D-aspartate) O-methyltransferase [Dehalococcoidia bacterium]
MASAETGKLSRDKRALIAEIAGEIGDRRVLTAMEAVPRNAFLPEDLREFAYENRPLPIGYGQTVSQPLIVAMMTQALMLKGDERVLEVGTGSGYQAAVLSLLAAQVVTVERIAPLAEHAAQVLSEAGYDNVEVHVAGDELGWPAGAPYDGIIVTAASPEIPPELLRQSAMGGRLVIPVGSRDLQELVRIVKTPIGAQRHNLGPCRFVPLLGRGAWPTTSPS